MRIGPHLWDWVALVKRPGVPISQPGKDPFGPVRPIIKAVVYSRS
jgi:hypothetical protein